MPDNQTSRAREITIGATVFNVLSHYGFPTNDIKKASGRIQKFLSRECVGTDGAPLYHHTDMYEGLVDNEKGEELTQYFEQLHKNGGIITLNHPTLVFLDPTAVLQLLPDKILKKTIIITSTFQFPMNQELFDKNGEGKFVPARATRDYIKQLHLLKSYVENGGCVLLIPNGTESGFQGTFRKMLQRWDPKTLVLDFTLNHEKEFQGYANVLIDRFRKPSKITIDYNLLTIQDF